MRPSMPSPASVTPRCSGYVMPSRSIASTRSLYACTMTRVLLDFIETTTLSKSNSRHCLRNSIADSTMPSGVSP